MSIGYFNKIIYNTEENCILARPRGPKAKINREEAVVIFHSAPLKRSQTVRIGSGELVGRLASVRRPYGTFPQEELESADWTVQSVR